MKPILLIAAASILLAGIAVAASEPAFTDDFDLENCRFASEGGNPYFILKPGRQAYFSNYRCVQSGECEELEELWITVRGTRDISLWDDGKKRVIQTRVVEEKETADGELVEISRNFFASCLPNRDVYYFGEDVDIYEDGEIVSHDGAWRAGRHGAEPGIIMPESAFIIGQRYFQELAPDVALDRAEHVAIDLEVEVPAGVFEDCVNVIETTPLEPGSESSKTYCPGVGLVADGELELVSVFGPPKHR
jgi:hypothetical protein